MISKIFKSASRKCKGKSLFYDALVCRIPTSNTPDSEADSDNWILQSMVIGRFGFNIKQEYGFSLIYFESSSSSYSSSFSIFHNTFHEMT